jgi:hypothetical protein
MRMADGGYRPAYNGQLATDATSQIIVGIDVVTQGTDHGQIEPMREQIERRYGTSPGAAAGRHSGSTRAPAAESLRGNRRWILSAVERCGR